jgi:hypothetical protein
MTLAISQNLLKIMMSAEKKRSKIFYIKFSTMNEKKIA